MSSSGSKAGIDWILLCHWSCSGIVKNEKNALFDSSPHINHTLPQVIHIPHLPKIWHGASFSYCACHLLRHYRPRSRLAAYDNHYRQRLVCVYVLCGRPAFLAQCQPPTHIFFSTFGLYFDYVAAYSVMYLVFLCPVLLRKSAGSLYKCAA